MLIDGEYVVRAAGHGYNAETVTFELRDVYDSQIDLGPTNVSSETVDQCCILHLNATDIGCKSVVPEGHVSSDDLNSRIPNHQSEREMIVDSDCIVNGSR